MNDPIVSPLPTIGKALLFSLLASVLTVYAGSMAEPWPEGADPAEVGLRVAKHYASDFSNANYGNPWPPARITYPEVCTWHGALDFAKITHNEELKDALVKRFAPLWGPVNWPDHPSANPRGFVDQRHLVPIPEHVDYTVFCAIPLEIYLQTGMDRYRQLGLDMADWQWAAPEWNFPFEHPVFDRFFRHRPTEASWEWHRKGYSWQTRLWIDDMYMITMAQSQAYRVTGDRSYIERAARQMVLYLDELQRENGLFYHAPGTPYFWGRGNGWMAAGSAELLRSLPKDSPHHARILEGYRLMMNTLLAYQNENGLWNQLIDDPESWSETSGSAMFTFAFIVGVKNGWLDESIFGPAARKGWLALVAHLDESADLLDVCQGTNAYDKEHHGPDGRAYYLSRQRLTGDLHGQAPILWSANAWLRGNESN
jgi:unsaturated rhamnogalacturonyl hydrolase